MHANSGESLGAALQIVQIALALPIVASYALLQLGVLRADQPAYLITNLLAAAGLAVTAVITFQLGFVITNVLWVVVSALGLRNAALPRTQA